MITPTTELLKEAIEDTDELIEYVLSSSEHCLSFSNSEGTAVPNKAE